MLHDDSGSAHLPPACQGISSLYAFLSGRFNDQPTFVLTFSAHLAGFIDSTQQTGLQLSALMSGAVCAKATLTCTTGLRLGALLSRLCMQKQSTYAQQHWRQGTGQSPAF